MVNKGAVRKVLCKFASPVLGRGTPRYLSQLDHWLKNKGSEWVSERLKAVYQAADQLRGNDPDSAAETLDRARISRRKDIPVPRGPLGQVALAYVRSERPVVIRRASALLRAYTGIFLHKVSDKQVRKAREDITSPSTATPQGISWSSAFASHESHYSPHKSFHKDLVERIQSFDASRESGLSRFYCGQFRLSSDMRREPYASAALSSLVCGDVPAKAVEILGDLHLRREAKEFQEVSNLPGYGKISFLQEGGCKARVVCQPSFWLQVYFRPASDLLFERIRFRESHQGSSPGISVVFD